jgi:hypothetical protein
MEDTEPWTAQEDETIYREFRRVGTMWRNVARCVPTEPKMPWKTAGTLYCQSGEQALVGDTEKMLTIPERMLKRQLIPEPCWGYEPG